MVVMRYETLSFCNIKGRSGEYDMAPVTIVSGPNRSGKSAFLEALRLSATGRCSLGASRAAMAAITSSSAANATIRTRSTESVWSISIGDTVSLGGNIVDLQGGMPVTVGDMWGLTAEQRMSLVGGKDALERNAIETADIKEQVRLLTTVINTPQPAAPAPYGGPPVFDLDTQIQELTLKIAAHDALVREREARAAAKSRHEETLGKLLEMQADGVNRLSSMNEDLNKVLALTAARDSAIGTTSAWLWGRLCVSDVLLDVYSAMRYVGVNTKVDTSDILSAVDAKIHEGRSVVIPDPSFDGKEDMLLITGGGDPVGWASECRFRMKDVERDIKKVEAAILDVNEKLNSIARLESATGGCVETDVMELDSLKKMRLAAHEWSMFEENTGEWAVNRAKSIDECGKLKQKLDELTAERASIVGGLKANVEDKANDMLSRVGLSRLEIEVVTTAKRASLKVNVDGVAIEALAASERLLYGLCLLVAIQQSSDAPCPILVAECAEMDTEMYKRVVDAIGTPSKGNVVLEHWLQVPGSIVMGGQACGKRD